jgi:hypothetical protein
MVNALGADGIAQRPRNVFLPNDISKTLWSPLAGGNDVFGLE